MVSRILQRESFVLTDDRSQMSVDCIHSFLSTSYWARGIPKDIVARAIEKSLCFGLFQNADTSTSSSDSLPVQPPSHSLHSGKQIGFARVITDEATFAYLCDVYVLEEFRNRGLGQWLIEFVLSHPSLVFLRRFMLITRDAHSLYRRFGFSAPANPGGYMEIAHPNLYLSADQEVAKERLI